MRRPAYSLVEVLVVLGVIAALVGLLIPAVQKVREAAARARSLDHLHQLAIASHAHASATDQRLPGNGRVRYDGLAVVFFDLLPYVEQESLYREFTVTGGVVTPPAAGGPAKVVALYASPKDGTVPGWIDAGKACASYTPNPGVFVDDGTLLLMTDGTAQTTMFAERVMRCGDVPNPWFAAAPDQLLFGAFPPPRNFGTAGPGCDPERVSTPHPTTILVAMADGSTRAVSQSLAAVAWVTAADPADGGQLPSDW